MSKHKRSRSGHNPFEQRGWSSLTAARLFGILLVTASVGAFLYPLLQPKPLQFPQPDDYQGIDTELAASIRELLDKCVDSQGASGDVEDLAELYLANNLYELAIETYEIANKDNPSVESLYRLGYSYQRVGNIESAAESFDRARQLGTSYPPVYWRLAFAQAEMGKYDEALPLAEHCLKLMPRAPQFNLIYARLLLDSGKPELALEQLDKIQGANHNNKAYEQSVRNDCLRQLGRENEILLNSDFRSAKPHWTDPWISRLSVLARGVTARRIDAGRLFRNGDFTGAIEILGEFLTEGVANENDRKMLSSSYLAAGQEAAAIPLLRDLAHADPGNYELKMTLAQAYTSIGNSGNSLEEAKSVLKDAMEQAPARWEAYDAMGMLFQLEKNPEEALNWFNQACEKTGGNPGVCHVHRISLLLEMQQWEAALKRIAEFPEQLQNDPFLILARARSLAGMKNWDLARMALQQMTSQYGDNEFWKPEIEIVRQIISNGTEAVND